jgi:hypothetical protein
MSDGTVTLLEKIAAWEARIVSLDAFADRLQSMLLALTKESLRRDKLVHERFSELEAKEAERHQTAHNPNKLPEIKSGNGQPMVIEGFNTLDGSMYQLRHNGEKYIATPRVPAQETKQEPKQEREPGWYWTKNPDGKFLLRYWDGRWWGVTENMTAYNTLAAYLPIWVGQRIEVPRYE